MALAQHLGALAVARGCRRFEWSVRGWNEKATFLRKHWRQADSQREPVGVRSAMVLSQMGVIRDAVLAGAGHTFSAAADGGSRYAIGRLIRLLPEWRSPSRPVLALYLSQRQLAPKLRTFIDLLALRLPLTDGFESAVR